MKPPREQSALRLVLPVLATVVLVAATVVVVIQLDARARIVEFLDWIDGLGMLGPVLLIAVDALVVILVLPGVMLTLGAGFLFGVVWGCVYIVIGTSIGATIAFLIARHVLGERAADYLRRNSRLRILDTVLVRSGWKFILATRLIPFFPFKLANYVFGLARFKLGEFVFATVIGIIPFTLTNVYIGSLAADLATLGVRERTREPWEWALYAGGLLVAIGVMVYLARIARRALQHEREEHTGET